MSIFHMGHEARQVARQRTLFGRPLTMASASQSKMTRRALGLLQAHFDGPSGMDKAEAEFFGTNVQVRQHQLARSLWNPYHIPELADVFEAAGGRGGRGGLEGDDARRADVERRARAVVADAYRNLGAEWDGTLDDPVSIFSLADPNLYRQYYAMCQLRALAAHPAYLARQRSTVHGMMRGTPAPHKRPAAPAPPPPSKCPRLSD